MWWAVGTWAPYELDYETWAGGDDSREATGNLFDDEIGLEEEEGADVEKA